MAARPRTLPAGAAPVVIGTAAAYAHGGFHALSAACALLGSILLQIGVNYANDYSDFVNGADTATRVGPTRATQAGLVAPHTMRNAAILVFLLAIAPGSYLVFRGGMVYVAVGVAAILIALLYTGGPVPLGYLGLGDALVLLFFGPVAVVGAFHAQTLTTTPAVWIASLGPGLLAVALLTVNNLRDIDEDRQAGKRTLAVRLGASFARFEYACCIIVPGLVIPMVLFSLTGNRLFPLTPLAVLPLGVHAIRAVYDAPDAPALIRVLGATGRLLAVFSLVFSLGWLV